MVDKDASVGKISWENFLQDISDLPNDLLLADPTPVIEGTFASYQAAKKGILPPHGGRTEDRGWV